MMSEEKRKRSPNWLISEKVLLLDLVEKHYHVIENKKTTGAAIKQKASEWKLISNEYNSQTPHTIRSAETLRAQWENMKKAAKKEEREYQALMQTGDGALKQRKEDPIHECIINIIKTNSMGLYNPSDNDNNVPVEPTNSEITEHTFKMEITPQFNVPEVKDWEDYTPQLPQSPVSDPLQSSKNKTWNMRRQPANTATSISIENLRRKKMEAIDLEMACASEEMQRKKKLSAIEMEIKKEILKQEKIKTKILKLELRQKLTKDIGENSSDSDNPEK